MTKPITKPHQFFKITGNKDTPGFSGFAGCVALVDDDGSNLWTLQARPMAFRGKADGLRLMTEICDITEPGPTVILNKIEACCRAAGLRFERTPNYQPHD
jgi:hypothetical protein